MEGGAETGRNWVLGLFGWVFLAGSARFWNSFSLIGYSADGVGGAQFQLQTHISNYLSGIYGYGSESTLFVFDSQRATALLFLLTTLIAETVATTSSIQCLVLLLSSRHVHCPSVLVPTP